MRRFGTALLLAGLIIELSAPALAEDASAPNPAVASTIASVATFLGLGGSYVLQPEPGNTGMFSVFWPSSPAAPGANAEIAADGQLIDVSVPMIIEGPGPALPAAPWSAGVKAAERFAAGLGGPLFSGCSPTPVKPSLPLFSSSERIYLFRRLQNGIPVYLGSQPEGITVQLDPGAPRLQNLSITWTHGLDFPSPGGALSPAAALAAWRSQAAPLLEKEGKAFFYGFPDAVDAFTGRTVSEEPELTLPGSQARVVPTTPPPVTASAATAYLDALGLLPSGVSLVANGSTGFIAFPGPSGGPTPPPFAFEAFESIPGTVYQVSYQAGFDAAGRLVQYSLGYQSPAMSGGGPPPGLSSGEAPPAPGEVAAETANFLGELGYIHPSDWRLSLSPLGFSKPAISVVEGVYRQNGILDLRSRLLLQFGPGGLLENFNYEPPKEELSPPPGLLGRAAVLQDFERYFRFFLRYQVGETVRLTYDLTDRRGAAGIDATDGLPVDFLGRDIRGFGEELPPDVPPWARRAVTAALGERLLGVGADGLFHPGEPAQPAKVLAALLRLRGNAIPEGGVSNADLRAEVFRLAQSAGVTEKSAAGAEEVSRLRFAVWLARALGFERLLAMRSVLPVGFADLGSATGAERNAVALLADLGYLKGTPDGLFHPDKPLTRAEFAVVMERVGEP